MPKRKKYKLAARPSRSAHASSLGSKVVTWCMTGCMSGRGLRVGTNTRGGLFGVLVPAFDAAEAPASSPCDRPLGNNKLRQFPGDPTCAFGTGGGDGRRNEENVSSGGAAPARKATPRAAKEGREGARENGLRNEALLGAEALTGVSGARMRSRDDLADGSSSVCKKIQSDSARHVLRAFGTYSWD